jgi:NADPH-dependent glutamate synthase beta subunit-like oxidoreductase
MKTFEHRNAKSIGQATALLSKYKGKARLNAGGTDLLSDLKDRCVADYPEILINIKTIPNLSYIKAGSRGLKIGALTKLADVIKSPEVRQDYSLLTQAASTIASPNLRNMATVGGNLAQDIRCWYYRYPQQIGGPIVCLRKGGKTCSALVGDNRYHSIFGAAPASDRRCASHCPAHIDIPGYLRLVRENNIPEAARTLLNYNPFPAITGRVCPIFCESNCNRSEYDAPVAIHSIERAVGDYVLAHAAEYFAAPQTESGRKIAIIGSGPAGLAAAFYLRRAGHEVTVYEKLPEAGGMLLYSIPPYRLPKDVVRKQIQALEGMGIRFNAGVDVDAQLAIKISSESDAVFVAGGTWRSLKLGVPGEAAPGVYSALDYLEKINTGKTVPLGKRVIVIGGGSVAIDAARTARRTGSDEVHIVCLETRDLASKDRMPALDPEILEAEEEGIVIHSGLGIKEIALAGGRAAGIETKKCTSVREADGVFNPQYDAASPAPSLQGDSIIVAIGQTADAAPFVPGGKVFIGGDMLEGPSTVVQALASAKKTVEEIKTLIGEQLTHGEADDQPAYAGSQFENIARVKIPEVPATERIKGIQMEDVAGLSAGDIQKEACRCVSCGCLAVGPSDLAIALVALDASIVTSKRTVSAQAFFSASATSSTVLESDELIKEVRIPKPPKNAQQRYVKFTLRKPIDFAIVSVASVISSKNGICSDAKIMLGAIAPSPLRAVAAEAAIKGKPIDEESAAEAAKLAMGSVQPLSMNQYKVDIAQTLIKRSILGIE